jgi:hypothetical protein
MSKQDLVLGAIGGYKWEQVNLWALSLISSGYTGLKAVIVYDNNADVIANFKQLGFQVIEMPLRGSIYNQRFHDFYEVMKPVADKLRYCVVTDARDVYFQSNPMDWLAANLTGKFYAVGEGIKFKDEAWNRDNLNQGFPAIANNIMDKCVYNVGVLAGEAPYISDLCLAVSQIAKSTGFPVADQSGYNLLLDSHPYKDVAQIGLSEDGFACQAGTFADPKKVDGFRPFLLEPEPVLDEEGVKTAGGKLYPVVHQYDRVPEWDQLLRFNLNEKLEAMRAAQVTSTEVKTS